MKHWKKKNGGYGLISGGVVTATTSTTTMTTTATAAAATKAGYVLSPLATTVLCNAPLIAFGLVQMSGISPIRHILREKQTMNYSPFPFVSLITNCSLWTLYGHLANDNTIFYANMAGILAGLSYTSIFHKYTSMKMFPYYFGSFSILSVLFGSSYAMLHGMVDGNATSQVLTLLGSVGAGSAVVLMASPLVTVQQVLKDKCTESMPFTVSLAMTVNGFSWFGYGWLITGDPFVYVPNALGFIAGMAQMSLFAIYPSKKITSK